MVYFTPACSASDGHRLFVVSLLDSDGTSNPSLTSLPAQSAFTRQLVLLESQSGPASLGTVSWTVISTYPPTNSSSSDNSTFVNDLDLLVGDFTQGMSTCQVDSTGNFVWLTSRSAVKTSGNPSNVTISNVPKGVQYVIGSSGNGGSWSLVSTSRQDGSNYLWDDQINSVGALLSIAPGVFVHALGSTVNGNITLALMTAGGNLVQSTQTWEAPNVGSSPKAFFLNNRSLFVLGAGNNLTTIPFSQTARDVQTLVNFQQSVNVSQTSTIALSNMPSVCTTTELTRIYPAVANNNAFMLCSSSSVTASSELLVFNGTTLSAPSTLPPLVTASGNITSFAAVASLSDAPGGNAVVVYSVGDDLFGAEANSAGVQFESGSFFLDIPSMDTGTTGTSQPTEKTGGIVGSVISAIVVVAIILWCRIRRRQKSERITQIFERHDPVSSANPQPYRTDSVIGLQPSPNLPTHPPFAGIHVVPAPSEEEQDQAHIEMIRMQLRPAPPSIAGGFESMVQPHAPASDNLEVLALDDYSSHSLHGSPSSTSRLITQMSSSSSGYHDQEAGFRYEKKEDHSMGHYADQSEASGSSLSPPPPPYRTAGVASSMSTPSAPPLPPF
ncbi:hypothetical protein EMPS_04477 [Entomortierella parvispora]|uniref:Transmembrane protein n=1 Tax=Entomortierella parvispora TaxID=205924 RepID=A0A9P3H8M6_9FUNG|nr:hypothetical protein EMPS_04477 [Entomortierella parvispora]